MKAKSNKTADSAVSTEVADIVADQGVETDDIETVEKEYMNETGRVIVTISDLLRYRKLVEAAAELQWNLQRILDDFETVRSNIWLSDFSVVEKRKLLTALMKETTRLLGAVNKEVSSTGTDHLAQLTAEHGTKVVSGSKYKSTDFAYAPDPDHPETWQLLLVDKAKGEITTSQLAKVAAILSTTNIDKSAIPLDDLPAVRRRLRLEYDALGVSLADMPQSVKEASFIIRKEKDTGRLRWLAIYSNNYTDREQEIISQDAHKEFVRKVDAGLEPYPELWLWHVKGTRWGVTDMLAYDDETGFAIACGLVDVGKEEIAEKIKQMGSTVAVSHGMPLVSLEFDPADPRIITGFAAKEISPLPFMSAANWLTGFVLQ